MEIKGAIEQLRQVRDNTSIPNYAKALDIAIRCMDEREAMLADLKKHACCETCKHNTAPLPCEGADYLCSECPDQACVCHNCEKGSLWEWRGGQEGNHGQQNH